MQNKSYKTNASMDQSQTIVQCPQCQTKFAVEASVLAEVSAPRFHCSRCDFVFALETKASPSATAIAPSPSAFSVPEPRASIATEPMVQPRAAAANETPAWSIGTPSMDRPSSARALEIPRNMESSSRVGAPHETHRDNFDFTQMKLDFKKSALADAPISTFDQPLAYSSATAPVEPKPARAESLPAIDYQRPSTRWSGLAYVAAPLIFFLSLLIGISYYFRQHNEDAEKLFASLTENVAQVAPAELSVINPKFKRLALDSGESAYLVSGSIKNTSTQTFRDVKLEGIGFDDGGELVARTQVDAGATLTKTRVRSLTTEMIKNLQSGQLKNKIELKPGESEDFSFALLDGDPSKARYFAARIYSVAH